MRINISREFANVLHVILDQWIPPFIRDSKWFIWLPYKFLLGSKAVYFFEFKEKAFQMTEVEFRRIYEMTLNLHMPRLTDLNNKCIHKIQNNVHTDDVLEVGTGRGYLANLMSENHQVTACDIIISDKLANKYPKVKFADGNIENLPFDESRFGTVVCTHTLEHVQNLVKSIQELRRVAKKRLIIVVPKQRPYKYTFDLHLHFFPYKHSLLAYFAHEPGITNQQIFQIDGDLYYQEDYI